jgi:hypothetical protein
MVMVMVVAVMMMRVGKHRGGKHHQEQCSGKNLLHEKNVPR